MLPCRQADVIYADAAAAIADAAVACHCYCHVDADAADAAGYAAEAWCGARISPAPCAPFAYAAIFAAACAPRHTLLLTVYADADVFSLVITRRVIMLAMPLFCRHMPYAIVVFIAAAAPCACPRLSAERRLLPLS